MNFLDIIKNAVMHTIQNLKFADIYVGLIVSESPLKIKIDDKLTITENEIVVTQRVKWYIKNGVEVIMIRESGGQHFFLIDKVLEYKKLEGDKNDTKKKKFN